MKIKSRIGHIFNAKRKITMFGFDETSLYFAEISVSQRPLLKLLNVPETFKKN